MQMTPKTLEIFEYLKENGRVTTAELSEVLGREIRSLTPSINILTKAGVAVREYEQAEVEEGAKAKQLVFVKLTEEGLATEAVLKE